MGTATWWCRSLLQQTRGILFHPHQFTILPFKCQHNRGEWVKDWVLHFQCLTSSLALSTSCQHLHRTGEMNSWAQFLLLRLDRVTSTARNCQFPSAILPKVLFLSKTTPKHVFSTSEILQKQMTICNCFLKPTTGRYFSLKDSGAVLIGSKRQAKNAKSITHYKDSCLDLEINFQQWPPETWP